MNYGNSFSYAAPLVILSMAILFRTALKEWFFPDSGSSADRFVCTTHDRKPGQINAATFSISSLPRDLGPIKRFCLCVRCALSQCGLRCLFSRRLFTYKRGLEKIKRPMYLLHRLADFVSTLNQLHRLCHCRGQPQFRLSAMILYSLCSKGDPAHRSTVVSTFAGVVA